MMGLQNCPKCQQLGFIWYVDEEKTPLTIWQCLECNYLIYEDENMTDTALSTLCSICPNCQDMRLYLQDVHDVAKNCNTFYWCSKCKIKTKIK